MSKYKIQVKLQDDTIGEFKSFVVDQGNGKVKEFDDIKDAEDFIQKIDQENLKDFMVKHHCLVSYHPSNQNTMILIFIDWYANLGLFDKAEFVKLLNKVYKIYE